MEDGGRRNGGAASPPKPQSEKAPIVDLHGTDLAGGQSAEFGEGSMSPAAALATPAALDVAGVAATLARTPAAIATVAETAEVAAPFLTNPATLTIGAVILVGVGAYYAYDYYQRLQHHQDETGSDQNEEKKPKGDGEAESARAPRFEGDNLGPPLDEPPEQKPPLPAPPVGPTTDSREPQGAERLLSGESPEDYRLGFDPARGKLSPDEASVGKRLEQLLGQRLERHPGGGLDWIDGAGKTYDAVGPVRSEYFNLRSFTAAIRKHLLKADFTVVDYTGLSRAQILDVESYISSLPVESQIKLIKLGA